MPDPVKARKGNLIGLHPNIVKADWTKSSPLFEMEEAPQVKIDESFYIPNNDPETAARITAKGASALFGAPYTVAEWTGAMAPEAATLKPLGKPLHEWHLIGNEAVRNRLGALGTGVGAAAGLFAEGRGVHIPALKHLALQNAKLDALRSSRHHKDLQAYIKHQAKRGPTPYPKDTPTEPIPDPLPAPGAPAPVRQGDPRAEFENPEWDPKTEYRINQLYRTWPARQADDPDAPGVLVPFPGAQDQPRPPLHFMPFHNPEEEGLFLESADSYMRDLKKRKL